jgi:MFS superfamily sulfate permease-like transporter
MESDLAPGGGTEDERSSGLADAVARFGIRDVLAGVGVALVLIPQSLAYAELALLLTR